MEGGLSTDECHEATPRVLEVSSWLICFQYTRVYMCGHASALERANTQGTSTRTHAHALNARKKGKWCRPTRHPCKTYACLEGCPSLDSRASSSNF